MNTQEAIDLIRDAGYGLLATMEGKQPRVRPIMPYLTDDGRLLVALLGRSRSISQVQANPLVEICFVDRKMWYCRVTGKAEINENLEDKETLWNNIPMLKQYFGSPKDANFKLMVIEIIAAEAMTPHQKTPEIVNFK